MMDKKYKYNLSALLKNIKYKNRDYFRSLSEEEQKAVSPFVVMRSLTATTSARQIFFINELVNRFVFDLKNKELLIALMMLCVSNDDKYLAHSKAASKKMSNTPKTLKMVMEYFKYNTVKAKDALKLISNDDLIAIAEELGKQKAEITVIKKELKARKV